MKKFLIGGSVAVFVFALSVSFAFAATITVGNDATSRTKVDTYHNFSIIDTNHPANFEGELNTFSYYASNTNPFRFILADGLIVKWVSDEIIPDATGVNTYEPTLPVPVGLGWNIGMYFASTGVIPFEYTGTPADYTPNNYGLPVVGNTLAKEGASGRTYSLVAFGTAPCATIEDGTIKDANGNIIKTGYDQWGYNYQAHMFNGYAANFSRPDDLATSGDKLIMKWSDAWLANVDCNGDGKLDRGLVDGVVGGISKGWLTNHYTGNIVDAKGKDRKYTDFYKIVWTGPGSPLWNQYTVIQEVWNDKLAGFHGLYSKEEAPGFGLNGQWTELP